MTSDPSRPDASASAGPAAEAGFAPDPRLAADCAVAGDMPLSRLLVMNDARYHWLILVPRRAGVSELLDLSEADHAQLGAEIRAVCAALRREVAPYKLNVAALGNMVRQLHVHVIARQQDDPAWPGPVWGVGAAQPYGAAALAAAAARWRAAVGARPV
ncbi:HIT domain-containing protein [Camelimonas abortus]|uniref:HIT domain-containing protein n=1 Tax=Camelimonas abortus TaxID=1017184 RepID=A0ABV7LIT0_9HYPH